jgi:phosphoribosylformylglycinamidine cyclo-ligase
MSGGFPGGEGSATYAAAGVDIEAGDRAVELMKAKVRTATRPEVLGGLGGFAGLFALDLTRHRRPVLATSTDGVGTKVMIAQALDKHDTIGQDLVGMLVDDLVVCGAEPLFVTDYLACGKVVPERVAEIVGGVADGCRLAGCALIGGETAEHPGMLRPDEYDIAGAATGIVEADAVLGPDRVREGDVLVAMAASGLHANGYSLVRHVMKAAGLRLGDHVPELGRTLGEELLEPTRIYAKPCLALAALPGTRTFSHVTGGGLPGNVNRVLPATADAVIDRGTWTPPAIVELIGHAGNVARDEREHTFNMGVGMVAVVAADSADEAVELLGQHDIPAWVAGEIVAGSGAVRLIGSYAR